MTLLAASVWRLGMWLRRLVLLRAMQGTRPRTVILLRSIVRITLRLKNARLMIID
ncbi:Glutamate 5-kinase [Bienertia sinuspersici]